MTNVAPIRRPPRERVSEAGPSIRRDRAVTIRGLSFAAADRKGREAEILRGVDLAVDDREFVSIVGPSGCGKSTLLNFVAGLLPVQEGTVKVMGGEPGSGAAIGYMFQQHGLLPWRSIIRNVELGLEIAGVARIERRRKAVATLAEMGLSGYEEHYPNELSGGMRQRVALARTLVADPQLILMDEPFGALDAQTKILIQDSFITYWEQHRKTVLFVTHDLDEAVALSDRVLVMGARPGRFIAEYTIDLPRPRTLGRLRGVARFNELTAAIWDDLKEEALAAMRGRRP